MLVWVMRFNIFLTLGTALVFAAGCHTTDDKPLAALRVHLEAGPNAGNSSETVPVYRANPVLVTVESSPFLTEADVAEAKVVDAIGGFALQIQFDRHGTWLLEMYSTANSGRHMAIFSQWGGKPGSARWLAAPLIHRRISNGLLIFTADATRDEVEQIALGLNNVAEKNKKRSKL